MHVTIEDPHPGRCNNYQHRYTSDRGAESRRCLGLAHVRHVCEFDPWPESLPDLGWSRNIRTAVAVAPEPWVPRPPRAAGRAAADDAGEPFDAKAAYIAALRRNGADESVIAAAEAAGDTDETEKQ